MTKSVLSHGKTSSRGTMHSMPVYGHLVASMRTHGRLTSSLDTDCSLDVMNASSISRTLDDIMGSPRRFEELRVWRASRKIVKEVYEITNAPALSKEFALRDQIRRAAVSIPSNIAEGFSRRSNREFVQFLFVAKGSLAEVQTQLYIALDQQYISQQRFDEIYGALDAVAKQISRLITYLKDAS